MSAAVTTASAGRGAIAAGVNARPGRPERLGACQSGTRRMGISHRFWCPRSELNLLPIYGASRTIWQSAAEGASAHDCYRRLGYVAILPELRQCQADRAGAICQRAAMEDQASGAMQLTSAPGLNVHSGRGRDAHRWSACMPTGSGIRSCSSRSLRPHRSLSSPCQASYSMSVRLGRLPRSGAGASWTAKCR
jgi:hypothetical protein